MPGRGPVIAIIGGGASGTLTAIHLLRAAAARQYPLRIALIDRLGRHGLGEAYSTTNPAHFLNALTARMSGVAGDPDHLLRWAGAAGLGDPGVPAPAGVRPLPPGHAGGRAAPGRAAVPGSARSPRTCWASGRVPAGRPMRLLLADGATLEADFAILATGNPPPSTPVPFPDSPWCIANPWAPGALDAVQDGRPVVILGTGLTMLDVVTAVTSNDPRTTVRAVSRHGMLPQVHRGSGGPADAIWLPALSDTGDPVRLPELIWQVRSAMASPAEPLAGRGRRGAAAHPGPLAAAAGPGQAAVRPACGPLLGSAPAPDAARDRPADHRAALYRAAVRAARPGHRGRPRPRDRSGCASG